MKKLVANADDFWKPEKVNKRITRFIVDGAVTSTSFMGNKENLTKIDVIKREDIGWRIHLNITKGTPVEISELAQYLQDNCLRSDETCFF